MLQGDSMYLKYSTINKTNTEQIIWKHTEGKIKHYLSKDKYERFSYTKTKAGEQPSDE